MQRITFALVSPIHSQRNSRELSTPSSSVLRVHARAAWTVENFIFVREAISQPRDSARCVESRPMVCSACGRKVDPNRSFCWACGSAVFLDGPRVEQLVAAPASQRRPSRSPSLDRQPRPIASTRSASVGCLTSLVRLGIFVGIVWYVRKWLLAIPEVRAPVDAFLSGAFTDAQLDAAMTAVRHRVLQLAGM